MLIETEMNTLSVTHMETDKMFKVFGNVKYIYFLFLNRDINRTIYFIFMSKQVLKIY
jgi:hypothetical protein